MSVKIIKQRDLITSEWSGGKTTELYIFPESSEYAKRNFMFRVSSASVDVLESNFTPLDGIKRYIMPLEGELNLSHKDHHQCTLKKNEVDIFWGNWQTTSHGKVIDFNLMTNGEMPASMMGINLLPTVSIKFDNDYNTSIVYLFKGNAVITQNSLKNILFPGDVAIITHQNDETTTILNASKDNTNQIAIARVNIMEQ